MKKIFLSAIAQWASQAWQWVLVNSLGNFVLVNLLIIAAYENGNENN